MGGHRTARVLVYTHRWLGILSGVLFVVWFVSGIVMIYARMPELGASERLSRLADINPSFIRALPPPVDGDKLTIGRVQFVVNSESNDPGGSPRRTWTV